MVGRVLYPGRLIKKNYQDAGLDVPSAEDTVVPARGRKLISTGIFMAVPEGFVGLIRPRSGLAVKHGVDVGAGVVDNIFRGEVKVLLFNHSDEDFEVKTGDRIAQLLTVPVNLETYESVSSLEETSRGADGFGSTGR